MTFSDLPHGWHGDLDAVALEDVVDLFTPERDRAAGALVVLLADSTHQLLLPMVVSDLPRTCTRGDREEFADKLSRVLAHLPQVGSAAFAIGRSGELVASRADLEWQYVFRRMCRGRGLDDLGVFVATDRGVSRLSDADVAAA